MSAPIVIDCGGSTRLKKLLPGGGYGDMAKLLDVHDFPPVLPGTGPLPVGAAGSQHLEKGPYATMSIVFQDATGVPFMVPVPLPASFIIASNLGQNVRGDLIPRLGGGFDLIITLYSVIADPLVEAKQHRVDTAPRKGKRRYVVSNAGPIKTVVVNDALPPVFDATNAEGPPPAPPIAPGAVGPVGGPVAPAAGAPLYVSVVVS